MPKFTQQLQSQPKHETASATIPSCHGVALNNEVVAVSRDGNGQKRVGLCDDSNTANCSIVTPWTQARGLQAGSKDSDSQADQGWTNRVTGSVSSAYGTAFVDPSRSWTATTNGTSIGSSTGSAQTTDSIPTSAVSSSTSTSVNEAVAHRGFFSNLTTSKSTKPELQNIVTVLFNKTETCRLRKCEDRYKTYNVPVPPALAHEWEGISPGVTGIRANLERDLRPIVSASGFAIVFKIDYVMVGNKVGEDFIASPHVLITCGTRRCKRDLEEFLSTSQPDYISTFNQPWIVHYEKTSSLWKASISGGSSLQLPFSESLPAQTSAQSYDLRGMSAFVMDDISVGCGTRIVVTPDSNCDAQSAIPIEDWARIGGVLTVSDQAYAFTTAHALLLGQMSSSKRVSRGSAHSLESLSGSVSNDEVAEPNLMLPQPLVDIVDDRPKLPIFSTIALTDDGAFGFADKGESISDRKHDVAIAAGSDWAMFKLSRSTVYENSYWATRHGASEEKIIVDSVAEESHLAAGPVKILQAPHIVLEGYLTQTTTSFMTGYGVFAVRQIVLDVALEAGTSGCWVVRNNQLCGHIIAGEDYANLAYMIPITRTLDGIKTVMGGDATPRPYSGKQATSIPSDQKKDQGQSQLTLIVSALQSSMTLYQALNNFENNRRPVRELKEELMALYQVLQFLQETVNRTDTKLLALKLPLLSCAKACAEFAIVVARCTVHSNGSRPSFRDWARLSYMGKDIAEFTNLMATYRCTITIALGAASIRTAALTASLLDKYKEMIKNTAADLEELLHGIDNKRASGLSQIPGNSTKNDDFEDEERASIQQCLKICDEVSAYADEVQTNILADMSTSFGEHHASTNPSEINLAQLISCRSIFEELSMSGDAHQVIVSTLGDLVSTERIKSGARSTQWLGQLSETALQQLLKDLNKNAAPTFSWASIDSEVKNEAEYFNDSQIDAVFLNAQCTLKGANPFEEVTDGFIILEAAMVQADVIALYGDDSDSSDDMGNFELTRHGMSTRMTADFPLVECLGWAESGDLEWTMKRPSVGDHLKSVTCSIFCIALGHKVGHYQVALVLGRTPRVHGAYERLGIMNSGSVFLDQDIKLAPEAWFADAERHLVKIV